MKSRLLPASIGACMILGGCASSAAVPSTSPSAPLRPISAKFLGATGVMNITAVQFIGAKNGWFGVDEVGYLDDQPVSSSPELMRTTDGGSAWTRASKVPMPILALDFLSPKTGFVLVGASGSMTLLAASDGGQTLKTISHPSGSGAAPELRFSSSTEGFLVSGGSLDVTTDGGRTWTSSKMALPAPPPAPSVATPSTPYFLTARIGFLAMSGSIFRTTDGGQSWQKVYSLPAGLTPLGGNLAAGPVTFVTTQLGYAALNIPNCWAGGCPDVIVRTEDGGASWQAVSGAMQGPLPGLNAPETGPPGGINEIVGWGQHGVIATTMLGLSLSRDGGAAWSFAARPYLATPSTFSVLSYAPGAGVLAAGMPYLMQLPPRGSWRTDWPAPVPTVQVDFVGPHRGFGLELEPGPILLQSTDAGRTWHTSSLPSTGEEPSQISFADRLHGWLLASVQGQPQILATSDGGLKWHVIRHAYAISGQLFPGGRGVVLAQRSAAQVSPTLSATSDGGGHFTARVLPKGFPVGGTVWFASPRIGFAVATSTVWQTVDGGRKWQGLTVPRELTGSGYVTGASVDQHGDLWLTVSLRNDPAMPEVIYIRNSTGSWQEIRVPFAVAQYSGEQSLDVISPARAWLLTPAGLYQTRDGGRLWRNLIWPQPPT